jgi:cytochrome c-type protein NapB
MDVPGLGFAPQSPHDLTPGMSAASRCQQCHVYTTTASLFVESGFDGAPQDLRKGDRLYSGAPPVAPHGEFMRENCLACHAGPAARAELVCTHPERTRCLQCHAVRHPAIAEREEFRR